MPPSPTTHEHVRRMLDEIHQRYNQRLTLTGLATMLRRQSAYLGRLFHDEIGVTVHEYVTRSRMVFGATQVRAGVKIEAVSLDLGFRSKKNFYRQFRQRFGMTPEAYRQDRGEAAARPPIPGVRPRNTQDHHFTSPDDSTMRDGSVRRRPDRPKDRRTTMASLGRLKIARALAGSCVAMGATATAVALTGYSVDELRAMPADVLFPNGSGSNATRRVQVLQPASTSLPANTVLQTKSAGRIPVHLTSFEILSGRTSPTAPRAFSGAPGAQRDGQWQFVLAEPLDPARAKQRERNQHTSRRG